jgi:hypothetical protein
MLIVWLGFNAIISAWLSHSVLVNLVLPFAIQKWWYNATECSRLILIAALFIAHVAVAVGVSFLHSVRVAVAVTSLILFICSLIVYFMLQRFAGPLDRMGIVISNPLLYPVIAFAAFLGCTAAIIMFCGWFWGVVPIIVWFVLGFLCAELAIRRYITESKQRGTDCARQLAIYAMNHAQGRRSPFRMDRYPFP